MRKVLFAVLLAAAVAIPVASQAKEKMSAKDATVTVKGEILDLSCYLGHGAKGEKHKECAVKCVNAGGPAGILTDKGQVMLLVLDHEKMEALGAARAMAGEMVEITGMSSKKGGMSTLSVSEVKKAEMATK